MALSDVGLTRVKVSVATMTMSPSVAFLAPEILTGGVEGPPSDVYSFGSLLYEMLTGKPAFEGESTMQVAHKISKNELPETTGIASHRLSRLLAACWLTRPSDRVEMSTAVELILDTSESDFERVTEA